MESELGTIIQSDNIKERVLVRQLGPTKIIFLDKSIIQQQNLIQINRIILLRRPIQLMYEPKTLHRKCIERVV